jgi:predicted transcriptional regulator
MTLGTILLSIKPEYVKKIIEGTKKYEYRKRLAKSDIDLIYIYCTHPVMKVVASVKVEGTISAAPSTLWEQTKSVAGINRRKFREYFKGCKVAHAYKLGRIQTFDPPKNLQEFDIVYPPQSFVYIE